MTGQAELDLRHHNAVVPDEDFGADLLRPLRSAVLTETVGSSARTGDHVLGAIGRRRFRRGPRRSEERAARPGGARLLM